MADQEYLREFEFLPNLPKSNLDDREFNDLVQECILRIPRYCPEWTNHNPGDPGITLVEMFAWLTDQMLYRFNQVPRRYYVAFLEMLGIRLQPPTAAKADLTFYLTKAQTEPKHILAGTEIATVRTETEEAVVFTTDENLVIGLPKITHLLTALTTPSNEEKPPNFSNNFTPENEEQWQALGNIELFETCNPENCFYLVLNAPQVESHQLGTTNTEIISQVQQPQTQQLQNSITSNVIAITFRGVIAATAGIIPEEPPLKWQAWNGEKWVDNILQFKEDDKTKGFSFHELGQPIPNPPQRSADVILYLPQNFPVTQFGNYTGQWIRCVYIPPILERSQTHYSRSPQISSIAVRSIGGTISARECVKIKDELLGISNGKPGQTFQLQKFAVLEREAGECIQVTAPGEDPKDWKEVKDFGGSDPEKENYVIDSRTGVVQFGPLVREPNQLVDRMQERDRLQSWGKKLQPSPLVVADFEADNFLEWQYGKIPTKGAEIRMVSYRVGGGSRGNVGDNKLTVLKTAIPYIKNVTNHKPAKGGKEGESLDQAVMRVPQILRTSKTAITPEDFENIAKRYPSVHSAYCPPCNIPGKMRVLIVPNLNEESFQKLASQGIYPDDKLTLKNLGADKDKLEKELENHKSLGIEVKLDTPEYVGIKVNAEVFLEEKSQNPNISQKIITKLYTFLNPITGGFDKDKPGWKLGSSVKTPDVIAFLQNLPEIAYVGKVELFSIRKHPSQGKWFLSLNPEFIIDPGKYGLICTWWNDDLSFTPEIIFLN